jgi:hypothetical protein
VGLGVGLFKHGVSFRGAVGAVLPRPLRLVMPANGSARGL